MKLILVGAIFIVLIAHASATINPSKNKKVKQKSQPEVTKVVVNKGPVERSVYERNLVDNEPLSSEILSEAHTYYHETSLKNFNGTLLGYVTPVIKLKFFHRFSLNF